jgi:dihydrodipicolinate synthase/N-acetylneuraminate lyase
MDNQTLRQRTRGIVVFTPTPFIESQGPIQVDDEGVRRNIEFLAQNRIPVVVSCGGVGELWDLTEQEHLRVVRAAAEQAAGRLLVYAGVCGDTRACAERAQQLEEVGADGVLLFPDDEIVPDAASTIAFYSEVSRAVSIGLMPFRADEIVDIAVLEALAALPNVVALKEERENMDDFRQIVLALGERLSIIGAGDAFAPSYFLLGGAGLACGLANFLPAHYIEMWEAAQHWDYRRVMELHTALAPLDELRRRNGISFIKAALELIGLAGGPCRSGRRYIDDNDRRQLAALLEHFSQPEILRNTLA